MRPLAPLLVGVLIGACGAPAPPPALAGQPASHVADAQEIATKTVALVSVDPEASTVTPYCAGVWVSFSSILTARHCTSKGESKTRFFVARDDISDLTRITARSAYVYASDEKHDLALLRAVHPPSGHGVASLHIGTIAQGSKAQTMGHPLGFWFSYSSGDIAAVRQTDLEADGNPSSWIQATTPISPGNSGGGLFDSEGALLGIADAIIDDASNIGFFVHTQYLEALLRAQGDGL